MNSADCIFKFICEWVKCITTTNNKRPRSREGVRRTKEEFEGGEREGGYVNNTVFIY